MKKYLPAIILLVILNGFFIPVERVQAQVSCSTPGSDRATCIPDGSAASTPTSKTQYNLLAPLPDPNNPGEPLATFDPADTNNPLGTYLNLIIKLIIGISAVLAVIMIVIGGIQYATSELISSKEAGKERIEDALLGLLIALGAWALLNTINPDLLNTNINIPDATVQVQLDLDSAPPGLKPFTGTLPAGPVAACTTGVVKSVNTGIVACSSMSSNIDQLIADAKKANFNIYAGGFRTAEEQKDLRIAHCNGNYTDASAVCHPPTAVPGHSEHESGLAFDIACNGSTITSSSSDCFKWLQTNASKYGLQNLAGGSEPWHWSVDGH